MFLFTGDMSNSHHISMFKGILVMSLSFYPFYFLSRMNKLKKEHLIKLFWMLLAVYILQFYKNESAIQINENSDNIVNNVSYLFVSLIPFIFLLNNKRLIGWAIMLLIMIFVIQGAKRGALITSVIGMALFFYYKINNVEKSKRIKTFIFSALAFLTVSYYSYVKFINNTFFTNRMVALSEGNNGGRDDIYNMIFNSWVTSSNLFNFNFIFGFGFAGSQKLVGGSYAHNDWLELISNLGLIGLCLYLYLFYVVIRIIMNNDFGADKRILFLTVTIIWFVISLGSMWYTNIGMFSQTILLAYLIGSKDKNLL